MLNARQVEAFRATILAGSVSAAAKRLHISQPSVSRLLGDLQRAVGFRLFSRSGRGVSPTPEALILFDEVDRMFAGLSELEQVARDVRSLARGNLRIAVIPALAMDAVADLVVALHGAIGRVAISVEVRSSHQILDWARSGQIDLGVVNLREHLNDVERIADWTYRCVSLLPAGHRLARSNSPLDLRELRGESIITIDSPFMMSICPDEESAEIFRHAAPVRVGVLPAAPCFARKKVGIAIVDPFTARCFHGMSDLVLRELQQLLRFELTLIRPAGRPPSLVAQKFSELAVNAFDRWQRTNCVGG